MSTIQVNRRELLRFMNSGDAEANGHHTGMTGLIGEPLAVGLLLRHLRVSHPGAKLVSWKVTSGALKGPRLDAWMFDGEQTLYQTEIKMWAGNAIGGLRLKEKQTQTELSELAQKQWRLRLWNAETGQFHAETVGKVLRPMQKPAGFESADVQPLLVVWWLVANDAEAGAWFTLNLPGGQHPPFEQVHVFSLTRYLMDLEDDILELEMPLLPARLTWLSRIFRLPGLGSAFDSLAATGDDFLPGGRQQGKSEEREPF